MEMNEGLKKKMEEVIKILKDETLTDRLRIIEKLGKLWRRENSRRICEEARKQFNK